MKLSKELEEVFKKQLTQEASATLRSLLEEGENSKAEVKALNKTLSDKDLSITYLQNTIKDLESKIKIYSDLSLDKAKLEAMEAILLEKERNMKISILELKLDESNKRGELVCEFTRGLVRNVEFRDSVFGTKTHNDYNSQTGANHSINDTITNDSTKTIS